MTDKLIDKNEHQPLTKAKNKRAASSKMKRIIRNKRQCDLLRKWVKMPANF